MSKHIDEGDANLNGTATEDRLGSAAQQAEPEGLVGEGPASSAPEAAAFGADAGDDPGAAVLSEEQRAESPEPAAPAGGRDDWEFSRRSEPRWRRRVLR